MVTDKQVAAAMRQMFAGAEFLDSPHMLKLSAAERMRAALEAAEAAAWEPIESAPKDGTEINAYRADHGVFTCRWATMEELVAHDEAGDPIEDYNEDQADWWHDRYGWLERELAPTRWRHLPQPPKETT